MRALASPCCRTNGTPLGAKPGSGRAALPGPEYHRCRGHGCPRLQTPGKPATRSPLLRIIFCAGFSCERWLLRTGLQRSQRVAYTSMPRRRLGCRSRCQPAHRSCQALSRSAQRADVCAISCGKGRHAKKKKANRRSRHTFKASASRPRGRIWGVE